MYGVFFIAINVPKDTIMQTLTAINTMLAAIAQAPVSTVESLNPYAIAAGHVLNRTNTEIQEVGWWFNTNTNVLISPDSDKLIRLPSNTLKIVDKMNRMNFVVRGNQLYDPLNNKSTFEDEFVVDIVVELPFEANPDVAANAIMRRAALQFFTDRDGEASKISKLNSDAQLAWSRLNNEGLYQQGVGMTMSPEFQRFTGRMGGGVTGVGVRHLNRIQRWVPR